MAHGQKRHEKDESVAINRIMQDMNRLHAEMGGRDRRPERVALAKCMAILNKELKRARAE